jgi:probable F420-dependent oxidoreductase
VTPHESAPAFRVGVQLQPQHTSVNALRAAWRNADDLGVDTVWVWDHFFPIYGGDPDGTHFEGWSLLAALAVETTRPRLGTLVSNVAYRSPDLLADMARTVDHLSGGRLTLGLGAGWFERDHVEYGIPFVDPRERVCRYEAAVLRVKRRLSVLNPPPAGPMPLLLGGTGPRMLAIIAKHADVWNAFVHPDEFAKKNRKLSEACEACGRDPALIERSALIPVKRISEVDEFLEGGAHHVIVMCPHPFDMSPVESLLKLARQ